MKSTMSSIHNLKRQTMNTKVYTQPEKVLHIKNEFGNLFDNAKSKWPPEYKQIYDKELQLNLKKKPLNEVAHEKLDDHITSLQNLAIELLKDDEKKNLLSLNSNQNIKGSALKEIDEKAKNVGELRMEESRTCCASCYIY